MNKILDITDCPGFKRLSEAVEKDASESKSHDYRGKLAWVVERAQHYAEKTGLAAADILDAWEARRDYWYMNYYQDANQPEIQSDKVRVFETVDELRAAIGNSGFRCPHCKGLTTNPYECNSGVKLKLKLMNGSGKPEPCNWKGYGLFGHMGKGICVFVKSELAANHIFMPIAWEESVPQTTSEAAS